MTTAQFITAIEAKPQFIKWAKTPTVFETVGEVEKHHGIAYITTQDGTNTHNVYFMVDAATGEATWQNQDQMEPEKNADQVKYNALAAYCKATFQGFFILRSDLVNSWAEVDTYTTSGSDLAHAKVLVFKQGNNPITHRKIV